MAFKSVNQVLENTDLMPLFSFVEKGMWFTPLNEDGSDSGESPTALGVKAFEETISIPAEVFRKRDQLEQYKSNLYFRLAKQFIDALFSDKKSNDLISIPSAAVLSEVQADPLKAYDLIKRSSYVNGGIYFNAAHASTVDFSPAAGGKIFPSWFNADSSDVLAFGAAIGSYNLWMSDVEIEEDFEMSTNKRKLTARFFVQGYPSLGSEVVKLK